MNNKKLIVLIILAFFFIVLTLGSVSANKDDVINVTIEKFENNGYELDNHHEDTYFFYKNDLLTMVSLMITLVQWIMNC